MEILATVLLLLTLGVCGYVLVSDQKEKAARRTINEQLLLIMDDPSARNFDALRKLGQFIFEERIDWDKERYGPTLRKLIHELEQKIGHAFVDQQLVEADRSLAMRQFKPARAILFSEKLSIAISWLDERTGPRNRLETAVSKVYEMEACQRANHASPISNAQ